MKVGALLFAFWLPFATRCKPVSEIDWTCDFEASVARPLAEPDAGPDEAGALPPGVCGDTCGPPAHSCTFVVLDGGTPGAVCPVCTF